jgi:hypothetical protein
MLEAPAAVGRTATFHAAVVPVFNAVAFTIKFMRDTIPFAVQAGINAVTLLIKALVYAIPFSL